MAAVQVDSLTKSYGEGALRQPVLRSVSFAAAPAQLVMLLGPSGSGKTTLLAAVSGLISPDSGSSTLLGTSLWAASAAEREAFRRAHCGFIFQAYNLFPAFTASQQLEIALAWASTVSPREIRRRSRDVLTELGLGDKLHLRPHELSGGEKQRVAVARALAKRPALIFADEPTAALDLHNAEIVLGMLQRATREHRATILLVTHDHRLTPFADRVLRLEDGQLLSD
jgi:putative ABC transport system ATP-binding protein